MSEIIDAPDEVWVKACDAAYGFGDKLVAADGKGDKLAYVSVEIAKRAILAERKRCAEIATANLRNVSQLLSSPPQSSAAWDIRNAINSGERP